MPEGASETTGRGLRSKCYTGDREERVKGHKPVGHTHEEVFRTAINATDGFLE